MEGDPCCGSRARPLGTKGCLIERHHGRLLVPTVAPLCIGKGNLALLEGHSLSVSASRIHAQQQVTWFHHFPLCKLWLGYFGLLLSLKLFPLSTLTESWGKKRDEIFFYRQWKFLEAFQKSPCFCQKADASSRPLYAASHKIWDSKLSSSLPKVAFNSCLWHFHMSAKIRCSTMLMRCQIARVSESFWWRIRRNGNLKDYFH